MYGSVDIFCLFTFSLYNSSSYAVLQYSPQDTVYWTNTETSTQKLIIRSIILAGYFGTILYIVRHLLPHGYFSWTRYFKFVVVKYKILTFFLLVSLHLYWVSGILFWMQFPFNDVCQWLSILWLWLRVRRSPHLLFLQDAYLYIIVVRAYYFWRIQWLSH